MDHLDRRCRDLIVTDRQPYPFVEPFARFSVGFPAGGPMGLGALHPRCVLSTYHVSEPTLQCWLVEGGAWRAVRRRSLGCLPWTVSEEGEAAGLVMVGSHAFAGPDALLSSFTLRNPGTEIRRVRVAFVGVARPDAQRYMLPYFEALPQVGRRHACLASGAAVVGGLSAAGTASELSDVRWRVACTAGSAAASAVSSAPWAPLGGPTVEPAPLWYVFDSGDLELAPGATATWRFRLDLATADAGTIPALPAPTDLDPQAVIAGARARFTTELGEPPQDDLALRARLGLLRDGFAGTGRFAGQRVSLCTADSTDFSCVFFWDSLFSSVAIAPWNPAHARDAARAVFVDQDPRDGSSGERHWDRQSARRMFTQSPQMPVAAWAVWEQVRHADDRSFAREMWPRLLANHRFWEEFSDTDRDGLAEIRWSGQLADNSPLWDAVGMSGGSGHGCGWLPPIASVALNAFLYRDAGHIAALADLLGLPDAPRWRDRQRRIAEALQAICHVAGDRRYWDYNHHTREHRRVKTFWMFWPLWAGMPVPEDTRRDLIDGVLLDPRQFFGAVPFPSVAYDEPSHDPAGYWRGRAWPHISTWLCETLWRHDRREAADEAVRRTLAWYSASDGLRENLCVDPAQTNPGGFPDYNWGCAAVDLLATGRWRDLTPA